MVEFGLDTFGDIATDFCGHTLTHSQVIRNVISQAVLADQSGVDFFGVGEHHRADFAVSSPEVVLAVIAGRTERIRVSSAATVLSSDDPVRVFQRFSTLHAAANGRVEIILGRGWFDESFSLFGYKRSDYDALFDEKVDLFAKLLRAHTVTWNGRFRSALNHQAIYPPVEYGSLRAWLALGATSESVLRAANQRLPMMMAIIGGEPERFKPFVDLYLTALEKLGLEAQPIGVHSPGYVADTDIQAREDFWAAYKEHRDRLGAERGWPPLERRTFETEVDRGSLYVGSPEVVARKICRTVKALGLTRFNMKYSVGSLPHEKLLRSIELYGTKVIPCVRKILG